MRPRDVTLTHDSAGFTGSRGLQIRGSGRRRLFSACNVAAASGTIAGALIVFDDSSKLIEQAPTIRGRFEPDELKAKRRPSAFGGLLMAKSRFKKQRSRA